MLCYRLLVWGKPPCWMWWDGFCSPRMWWCPQDESGSRATATSPSLTSSKERWTPHRWERTAALFSRITHTNTLGGYWKSFFLTDSSVGAQKPAKDPGEETGQLYSLGPRQHPGGVVQEVPVPALGPQSQRLDDGQPHEYLIRKCVFPIWTESIVEEKP